MSSFKHNSEVSPTYNRGVSSWPNTVRKARALDQIVDVITQYLPPESGITKASVIARVIEIIETQTGHQFLSIKVIEPGGD